MIARLRLILVATLFSGFATASLANDPSIQDCSKVPDYRAMIACYEQLSVDTNAKVTQAYELMMKRLGSSPAADLLSRSQKAWLDYQSTYCDYVASANEGGSIIRMTVPSCRAEIAESRLRELEGQVNCQEGTFGCFPQH